MIININLKTLKQYKYKNYGILLLNNNIHVFISYSIRSWDLSINEKKNHTDNPQIILYVTYNGSGINIKNELL